MIVRPVHNILLLPDVSYYFKKDFFNGWCTEPMKKDDDVLFMLLKDDKAGNELTAGDFYPHWHFCPGRRDRRFGKCADPHTGAGGYLRY